MSMYLLNNIKKDLEEVRDRICEEYCKYGEDVVKEANESLDTPLFREHCTKCPLNEIFFD